VKIVQKITGLQWGVTLPPKTPLGRFGPVGEKFVFFVFLCLPSGFQSFFIPASQRREAEKFTK
jgi:hypothetical protein